MRIILELNNEETNTIHSYKRALSTSSEIKPFTTGPINERCVAWDFKIEATTDNNGSYSLCCLRFYFIKY